MTEIRAARVDEPLGLRDCQIPDARGLDLPERLDLAPCRIGGHPALGEGVIERGPECGPNPVDGGAARAAYARTSIRSDVFASRRSWFGVGPVCLRSGHATGATRPPSAIAPRAAERRPDECLDPVRGVLDGRIRAAIVAQERRVVVASASDCERPGGASSSAGTAASHSRAFACAASKLSAPASSVSSAGPIAR